MKINQEETNTIINIIVSNSFVLSNVIVSHSLKIGFFMVFPFNRKSVKSAFKDNGFNEEMDTCIVCQPEKNVSFQVFPRPPWDPQFYKPVMMLSQTQLYRL